MEAKLPFFLYFCICIITYLVIVFIDKKFNLSFKLYKKLKSMILVRAVELIVIIFLLYSITSRTNIDTKIINPIAAGTGIALFRKI